MLIESRDRGKRKTHSKYSKANSICEIYLSLKIYMKWTSQQKSSIVCSGYNLPCLAASVTNVSAWDRNTLTKNTIVNYSLL